jgi:hypothetical protein
MAWRGGRARGPRASAAQGLEGPRKQRCRQVCQHVGDADRNPAPPPPASICVHVLPRSQFEPRATGSTTLLSLTKPRRAAWPHTGPAAHLQQGACI